MDKNAYIDEVLTDIRLDTIDLKIKGEIMCQLKRIADSLERSEVI